MKLTIKVLQGSEFEIQIPETALVIDVKREIAQMSPNPVEYQKLLANGKTLLDDKSLVDFYKVKDGSKLMLVIKKPEPIKDVLLKALKKYYSDDKAEKIVKEFNMDFDEKMKEMSLDDLERLATSILVK